MENSNENLGSLLSQIKYPLVTEKAILLNKYRQYAFIVNKSLKKPQIKFALEKMFNVTIVSIKTSNLPEKTKRVGKFTGRKTLYKKAYIKLKTGDSIATLFN